MRKVTTIIIVAIAVIAFALLGAACTGESPAPTADQQREQSVRTRADVFASAQKAVPVPKTNNFPMRRALAEMTSREDLLNHPWYVYLLGDNGNTIGYYVSKYPPVNACDFLSSTEQVNTYGDNGTGVAVLTAPSLDGIYYGGSGASGACDSWVLFDSTTNAMIQVRGLKFYVADQPLALNVQPIKVSPKK